MTDSDPLAAALSESSRLRERMAAVRALCFRDGYTTWDVEKHLPGQGWKPDDPKVVAWETAHGHDPRLKCYPEYGCQLLIDPEDLLAILEAK